MSLVGVCVPEENSKVGIFGEDKEGGIQDGILGEGELEHTAPQEPHDLEEPSVVAPHLGQSDPCMMKRMVRYMPEGFASRRSSSSFRNVSVCSVREEIGFWTQRETDR